MEPMTKLTVEQSDKGVEKIERVHFDARFLRRFFLPPIS